MQCLCFFRLPDENRLLDDEVIDCSEELACILGMCNNLDGREGVESKDTHNGLCINNISALNEVYLVVKKDNLLYEISDRLNAAESDVGLLPFKFSFFR